MSATPSISLPLAPLLHLLNSRGFDLSPDQQVRAQQALHLLAKRHYQEPEKLKYLLAPLFAQDADQQRIFYACFDQWMEQHVQKAPEANKALPEEILQERRRWLWPLIGALGLFALMLGLWIGMSRLVAPLPLAAQFTLPTRCLALADTLNLQNQSLALLADTSVAVQWQWEAKLDTQHVHPQLRFQTPGLKRIRLRLTRAAEEAVSEQSLFVYQGPRPRAGFQIDSLAPNRYRFRADTLVPGWHYHWDLGAGSEEKPHSFIQTLASDQQHQIRLQVRLDGDAEGHCSATQVQSLDTRQSLNKRQSLDTLASLIALPDLETQALRVLPTRHYWPWYVYVFWVLLSGGLVLGGLFVQRYRRRLRPSPALVQALQAGERPPLALPFPNQESWISGGKPLYVLAEALRQRQAGERSALDLPATLRATAQGAGFPRLRLKYFSRPTEYLALIESQGPEDQQAQLFARLVGLLQQEQVAIDCWFYQGDPHYCFRDWDSEPVALSRLSQRYAGHRLMLFGRGQHLLQGKTLKPHLLYALAPFSQRALLTPLPVADWGRQEARLGTYFIVLPADLAGQQRLMENWEATETPNFSQLQLALLQERPELLSLQDYDLQDPEELRELLGERRFRWLAAAALYPRPVWAITLALGARLDAGQGDRLDFEDLLALTRIPWLQDGDLSESLRKELVATLDEATERKARAILLELLEEIQVPEGSFAAQEQHIQQVIQRCFLHPADSEARAALQLLWQQGLLDPLLRGRMAAEQQTQAKPRPLALLGLTLLLLALGLGGLGQFPPRQALPVLTASSVDSVGWYHAQALAFMQDREGGRAAQAFTAAFSHVGARDSVQAYLHGEGQAYLKALMQAADTGKGSNRGINERAKLDFPREAIGQDTFARLRMIQFLPSDSLAYPTLIYHHALLAYQQGQAAFQQRAYGDSRDWMKQAYLRAWDLIDPEQRPVQNSAQLAALRAEALHAIGLSYLYEGALIRAEAYALALDSLGYFALHAPPHLRSLLAPQVPLPEPSSGDSLPTVAPPSASLDTLYLRGYLGWQLAARIPVAGAQLRLGRFSTQSDSEGRFLLRVARAALAPGQDYALEVAAQGFQPLTRPLSYESPPDTLLLDTLALAFAPQLILEMVFVEGGTFLMGADTAKHKAAGLRWFDGELSQHAVSLSDYVLGRYEVTVGEYMAYVQATGLRWPEWLEPKNSYHIFTGSNNYYKEKGVSVYSLTHPITGVSWEDATAYCAWLSAQTGRSYTLPSEAQWEYAARGGARSKGYFYAGGNDVAEVAWYGGNSGDRTHAVGLKRANELGLYDMSGNVWECCRDWYESVYTLRGSDSIRDPMGPAKGRGRVLRGGAWDYDASGCRVSRRDFGAPSERDRDIGFRLSRTP